MTTLDMNTSLDWEDELGGLLGELSSVQQDLLDVLVRKRSLMAKGDETGMVEMQSQEANLQDRLESCYRRRLDLLDAARRSGKPASDIEQLTGQLGGAARENLGKQVKDAQQRSRRLQFESLTNWVLAQRSLLHLSQLLEIIATGGRLQPTYGTGDASSVRGCLLDHTV